MQEQRFPWYESAQVCGDAFLNSDDFMDKSDIPDRVGYTESNRPAYLPTGQFWRLGGKFREHPFAERRGDLDWMRRWQSDEFEDSANKEEIDRTYILNIHNFSEAIAKIQLKALTQMIVSLEQLTDEQIYEQLKNEKPWRLDHLDFKSAISLARREFEKEKMDQAFTDKLLGPVVRLAY